MAKKDEDAKKDKEAEEGGEEEGEATEGAKKGGKFSPKALLANKKKLIMIVAPVILVIILGVVGYTMFLKPAPEPVASTAAKGSEPKDGEKAATQDGAAAQEDESANDIQEGGDAFFGGKANVFEMKPFVVNLQDNSGTRYLKLTIGIELDSPATKKILKNMRPKVRNSLIILLSSKSYTEIGSIQGKYKLRDEIVERINHILQGDKVRTVYFIEFVVQ
ncbi:hypothetical protein MNBD_DELTA01-1726 [hydrothermal vent metagenome]|uniref:Flagellar protein FliL n=1 Tax=hydrothermal vent metagenome TaxID=652676 RepID=A0A3B0RNR1_9ZZZZ